MAPPFEVDHFSGRTGLNLVEWIAPIVAGEILFCGVLRHYVSQNIGAITRTLLLNRFDIADQLCCMYLIVRFSQLLSPVVLYKYLRYQ